MAMPGKPVRKKAPKETAIINQAGCTGCLACVQACPVDCIEEVEGQVWNEFQRLVEVDIERCIGCERCVEDCPWETIDMWPYDKAFEVAPRITVRSIVPNQLAALVSESEPNVDGRVSELPAALAARIIPATPEPEPAPVPAASAAEDHGHHADTSAYLKVFGALMVLTIVTVAIATFDFGHAVNDILAVLVAMVKGGLVMAIFMHLRSEHRTIVALALLPIFLVLVLFLLNAQDAIVQASR